MNVKPEQRRSNAPKSSYQKLKIKNETLKQDIFNLIRKADKMEGLVTKAKYSIQYDKADVTMFGNVSSETDTFDGLFGCLLNADKP